MIRKLTVITAVVTLLFSYILAEELPPSPEAQKIEVSANQAFQPRFSGGTAFNFGKAIIQAPDGGYVISAVSTSFGRGKFDAFIIKTDAAGKQLWHKVYGEQGVYFLGNITVTADNAYVFSGAENTRFRLLKTDFKGAEIWSKYFTGVNAMLGARATQLSDGGFIIAGSALGKGGWTGNGVWLCRTDKDGKTIWEKTIGGKDEESGVCAIETKEGGLVIAGAKGVFSKKLRDIYIIKTDAKGNISWEKTYGGIDNERVDEIVQSSDGGYVFAGLTTSYGSGESDIYLVKIDENGRQLWSRTFGGMAHDFAGSLIQADDGGYVIGGGTSSFGAGKRDGWIIKTDPEGRVKWSKTFGGPGPDNIASIIRTSDSGYIALGDSSITDVDMPYVYAVKIDRDGNQSWYNMYGGINNDGKKTKALADGGYIMIGGMAIPDAEHKKIYLTRTDAENNIIWSKEYKGSGECGAYSVCEAADGGFVVTGYDADRQMAGALLMKVDSQGNQSWYKPLGTAKTMGPASVKSTKDGGFIVAGMGAGPDNKGFANYMVKTDKDGAAEWTKMIEMESNFLVCHDVSQTSDGGYILTGQAMNFSPETTSQYLIKTGPDGTKQWSATYPVKGSDKRIYMVKQTQDGGYEVTGFSESYSTGRYITFDLKADSSGKLIKQEIIEKK